MPKFLAVLKSKPHLLIGLLAVVCGAIGFAAALTVTSSDAKTGRDNSCNVAACVALQSDKASPDTLTLKAGESAQFNSADGKTHQLSLGLGGEKHDHAGPYNSGEFKSDEAWRVQFKEPGTYKFHDHFNPKVNILVVVYKVS